MAGSFESPAEATERPVVGRPPDFLVIGAQKAGTTWLHRNLSDHPQVWLPPVKELHYLDQRFMPSAKGWESGYRRRIVEEIRQRLRDEPQARTDQERQRRQARDAALAICERPELDDRSYLDLFAKADPAQVCGEATPRYCTLPAEAIDHVTRLNPKVRAILVLRDPVARAVSHLRMLQDSGGIRDPSEGVDRMSIEGAVDRSDYGPMIDRWRSRLADGSLHLASYEELATDPDRFLADTCAFLGVRFSPMAFPNRNEVVFRGQDFAIHPDVLATLRARLAHVFPEVRRIAPAIAARWTPP